MSPEQLNRTAQFILNAEARRDSQGHLTVYRLPPGDGGGSFEVAGINDRYDHDTAWQLRDLLEHRLFSKAEQVALAYYITNTDGVKDWSSEPAVEAFLRDCAFNRGKGGAAAILQIALGVAVDRKVGPVTRRALRQAEADLPSLLGSLRVACETYERRVAPPVGARAKFWKGLVNRWNRRYSFAASLL